MPRPSIIIVSGPNGAGKSTLAPSLLADTLQVRRFLNADTIASGLSAFDTTESALAAGRIMLKEMKRLAEAGRSFAFETTLASRSFAPWLRDLGRSTHDVHLLYLWLPSPEMARARVLSRVRDGGHDVPEDAVHRRYRSGLQNLFELYIPLAKTWTVYDSSNVGNPSRIAFGSAESGATVIREEEWKRMLEAGAHGQG